MPIYMIPIGVPADDDLYRIEAPPVGCTRITSCDGSSVPLDISNPAFCHFLTWAAYHPQQLPPGLTVVPRIYFSRLEDMFEFCKVWGRRLYAESKMAPENAPRFWRTPAFHAASFHSPDTGSEDMFMTLSECLRPIDVATDGRRPTPTVLHGPNPIAPLAIPYKLLGRLNADLQLPNSDACRLSSLPVDRTFVYLDISDFSQFEPLPQALILSALIALTRRNGIYLLDHHVGRELQEPEASLCIGDGYIYAFADTLAALCFAAALATTIERRIAREEIPEFHFRIGIHCGDVLRFFDAGRNDWNYVGDGINGGNRVLSAIGKEADDLIFISDRVRRRVEKARPYGHAPLHQSLLAAMRNRGRHRDKHGRPWRVFELQHGVVRISATN
jgi:class 3 adenylate cyclase